MSELSAEEKNILRRHVSNFDKDIYLVYNLPPEVVAVLFAYVSRSPASFRENLLKLITSKDLDLGKLVAPEAEETPDYTSAREKAHKFHEKWVVGYGHASVAEHAVASIAMENVSIIASKVIEDNRLASFTEKSTRYQVFGRNRYYKPKKLMNSEFGSLYEETCNHLFDVYAELTPGMIDYMRDKYPRPKKWSKGFYDTKTKARACDAVRYILPASTLTNLAVTINARNLEHAIRKMLSHPLEEMIAIGRTAKDEAQRYIPTLIKYADLNKYIHDTNEEMEKRYGDADYESAADTAPVKLVRYDEDAEVRLIAAILYKYSRAPYEKTMSKVSAMSRDEKRDILKHYLERMDEFDWPMRELEYTSYTFDILMDFGAFRDVQRHRICSQTNQELTCDHGFEYSQPLIEAGYKDKFDECMIRAKKAYDNIRSVLPREAQYVVPLAYRKRTLFQWNLRSLMHFIKLRSGKAGHESYRRVAQLCYEEIKKVHSLIAEFIRCDWD
jgi:thymidylate synthase ThyX